MLSNWLHESVSEREALRGTEPDGGVTYRELVDLLAGARDLAVRARLTGVICNENVSVQETIVWAGVAQTLGIPCVLGGGVLGDEELFRLTPRKTFSHRCDGMTLVPIPSGQGPGSPHEFSNDAVILLTSGTTGVPKMAVQSWRALNASVRRGSSLKRRKWLLTYSPTRFAGIQVWLHALANDGTLVYPNQLMASSVIELLLAEQPEMVSATPTFWRQVLRSVSEHELTRSSPRVITLGGEVADGSLLRQLRRLFPATRVVQIYASTEAGVAIACDDGEEGLPIKILADGYDGNKFRIVDGELHIQSRSAMLGYLSDNIKEARARDFVATGDLVEIENDRILFRGRKDGRLNVGGYKVDPTEIERIALAVPGVALAHSCGRRSPVLGEVPALKVIVSAGHSSVDVVRRLQAAFKNCPPYKIPRFIETVTDLETTDTGKIRRVS